MDGVKSIKTIEYRYAIICKAFNQEYIYKPYADTKQLKRGIDKLTARMPGIWYRIAKIKITIEEG
ncbi:hypothetical protein HZF24_06920 [Sedimentibacter hydroxybenzoicus DSM 7310]|uniref:Uncharacterized protein n=1 Tax=Sedimentibacter hydroxybenzoicus DSM 7310 TaxID=1123245 RepID=A0A974GWA9_SEDHY|nr:hypothetical protein [Sedimentibacter hydroxybenzoicus]NYB73870.1 hypothetical protein [Sedimentibacter hydroxybenzoicus DSM 7310]